MPAKKPSYGELLKDPRWQKKRLEIMERDSFTCQRCYDDESTLHVHHKHYHKGRLPWEYEEHELVTLCETCHEGIHDEDAQVKDVFARLEMDGPWSKSAAVGMIAGWAYMANQSQALAEYFNESPLNFRIGEIAFYLDDLSIGELRDILDIFDRPRAERLEVLRAFIAQNKKEQ